MGTVVELRPRAKEDFTSVLGMIIALGAWAMMFGALFFIFGLALSGFMSERVAAALLIVFLMLAINSYLAAYALGVFKISQWKLGPTEMRLALIIGNLYLLHSSHTHLFGRRFLLFDVGGVVSIIAMGIMLVFSSIKNTHALYQLERLPER